MTVDTRLMSADELLRMPDDHQRHELVRGELRTMAPAGNDHGRVAARIAARLLMYVEANALGDVYGAETGFLIERSPDTVLAPDCAFVRADRRVRGPSYYPGPPDLAFEVVSPNDTYSEVEEKTQKWLRAGARAVVIVDPRLETVRVHRPTGPTSVAETLTMDELPGWSVPISEFFD